MSKNNKKMNAKRTLVSFLLIASFLFLAATVSATNTLTVASLDSVEVNNIVVYEAGAQTQTLGVIAGETIDVTVKFTVGDLGVDALGNEITSTSDVRIKAELEANSQDVVETTSKFDVEEGKTYVKTLTLTIPSDLDDEELSNDFILNFKIWNSKYKNDEITDIELRVQKVSYDLDIKSVMTSNVIEAGQSVPVDIVLSNIGYNDAEDVYVSVKIPELNIEKKSYFGDLVAIEEDSDDNDDENTVSGRFIIEIPYNVKAGKYTLVVEAENEETKKTARKEITIDNSVPELAMRSGNDLVLINPTNSLRVYKLIYLSNEVAVILPAASSKTVPIDVPANGDYEFDVSVFSGEKLLSTVRFKGSAKETQLTSPVFVLTVILAIVFLVLLVALIVLITKKPKKTEEFGESYY